MFFFEKYFRNLWHRFALASPRHNSSAGQLGLPVSVFRPLNDKIPCSSSSSSCELSNLTLGLRRRAQAELI